MKGRRMPIVGLALLLLASLSAALVAQTTTPPPAYTLTVAPASPTAADIITLTLAGTWPDDCPPNKLKVSVQGNSINIDMMLPGAEDGNTPVSKAIKTDWHQTATVGPLAVGTYNIYARGVSYTQAGGYVKLATISVQTAPAAPPTDPNTGNGPKPDESKPATDPNSSAPTDAATPVPPQKSGELAAPNGMKELALGVVVVLMDDSLVKECGLQAGQCGTIVACEGPGHAGMVLVTWPFFSRGAHEACKDEDDMPVAYPLKSARWIDTKTTPLGLCFDECGVLAKGQGDAIVLKVDDDHGYNLIGVNALTEQISTTGRFHLGDHVRVRGLQQVTGLRTELASRCPRQKGDVYAPLLSFWTPEPKVCPPCPGDKLMVDPGQNQVRIYRDPKCPGGKHTLSGFAVVGVNSSSTLTLSVTIAPAKGVRGIWKASLSADTLEAGQGMTVKVYVDVLDIDLSDLPAGKDVVVARINLNLDPQ